MESTIGGGLRSSSATAFLQPALSRKNLDVLSTTRATRLIQTDTRNGVPHFGAIEVAQTKTGTLNSRTNEKGY